MRKDVLTNVRAEKLPEHIFKFLFGNVPKVNMAAQVFIGRKQG